MSSNATSAAALHHLFPATSQSHEKQQGSLCHGSRHTWCPAGWCQSTGVVGGLAAGHQL